MEGLFIQVSFEESYASDSDKISEFLTSFGLLRFNRDLFHKVIVVDVYNRGSPPSTPPMKMYRLKGLNVECHSSIGKTAMGALPWGGPNLNVFDEWMFEGGGVVVESCRTVCSEGIGASDWSE
eukprot:GHVN01015171.1.p3 GENE.GHVN01015171.1~~GHVN01015171.1.p3  ORF type:complete len:123 (+),score=25.65 GHVN01015171.1:684-1052(+)